MIIGPIPSITVTSTADTISTLSTSFHISTPTTTTNKYTLSTTSLASASSSSPTPSHTSSLHITNILPQLSSINNTPHITNILPQPSNTHSQSSNAFPLTLSVTSPTPLISDGTAISASLTDSSISNPNSTEATVQSNRSTVSNTVMLTGSTVFMLLVVTVLVIILVSVLVCRRQFKKGNDISENECYTDPHSVVSLRTNDNNMEQQSQGNYNSVTQFYVIECYCYYYNWVRL